MDCKDKRCVVWEGYPFCLEEKSELENWNMKQVRKKSSIVLSVGGLCIGMIGIIIGNVLTVIIRLILEKKITIAF